MVIYNRLKEGGGFESYELEKYGGRVVYCQAGGDIENIPVDSLETFPRDWHEDALKFLIGHMRIIINHLRDGDMSAEEILNDYCFSQQREEK